MEKKDYSLLRPFDLEAAKRGDLVCWYNEDLWTMKYIGPSTSLRVGCFEWVCGVNAGTFETYKDNEVRMAPLCWVEGKPVYKGDVLYFKNGKAGSVTAEYFVQEGTISCPHGALITTLYDDCCRFTADYLTWTPPKVKREGWVNVYPNQRNYRGEVPFKIEGPFPSEYDANTFASSNRLTCVRIEVEEPAQVAE